MQGRASMSLRHRFTFLALAALLGAGCTKDVPAPQVPATVGATGVVQAVANGTTQVTAHAGALTSDPLAVTVSQNVAVLQKVIGDAQAAIVGGQLPESLTVQVFDRLGNPIDGAIVRFEATQGGGSVGAPSVFTTAAGRAATTWTLGMTPGAQQATASASVIQFVGDSMPSGDSVVSVTFGATAAALSFADIGAGAYHTCGRTTAGAAFCWGYGGFGQIGNGSMSETPT